MFQYALAGLIVCVALAATAIGEPYPAKLGFLVLSAIGITALFPRVVVRHRKVLAPVLMVAATLCVVAGFAVSITTDGVPDDGRLGLISALVAAGTFGLMAVAIPTAYVESLERRLSPNAKVTQRPDPPPTPRQQRRVKKEVTNPGAFTAPSTNPGTPGTPTPAPAPSSPPAGSVDPVVMFSHLDKVLRATEDSANLPAATESSPQAKPPPVPGFLSEDADPTSMFTKDELDQLQQFHAKAQSADSDDEDPTTMFTKDELDVLRQYAERVRAERDTDGDA